MTIMGGRYADFNSRSRAGSDFFYYRFQFKIEIFQFTLPCGERRPLCAVRFFGKIISIHAPVRGATHTAKPLIRNGRFQFTLPCGERRKLSLHGVKPFNFNSRSRAGSDVDPLLSFLVPCHFNSRSRAGSDRSRTKNRCGRKISIHAPVRGATEVRFYHFSKKPFQFTLPCGERQRQLSQAGVQRNFNSRSRAGSDVHPQTSSRGNYLFQFTLPCGERR